MWARLRSFLHALTRPQRFEDTLSEELRFHLDAYLRWWRSRCRQRSGRTSRRLEHQGLISSVWGQSENKRRAKYYTLTPAGRKRLKAETEGWNRLASGIAAALGATPDEV